jgi:hypothetical protein
MISKVKNKHASVAGLILLATGLAGAQTDPFNTLHSYEEAQGFELMFDGSTAASFRDRFSNYTRNNTTNTNLHTGWTTNAALTDPDFPGVAFGAIVNGSANIDIRSRRLYRDFDLRFEYRNSGNQGVIYRFDVTGAYAWETGIEFGIDNSLTTSTLFQTGAAYDLIAPSSQPYHVRSSNKWNKLRIVAKGDSVEHWMNDVKVVSYRYWSEAFLAAYNRPSKWTAYPRFCQTANNNRQYIPEGYIGLQGDHGGAWQIRRMRILHDSTAAMDRVKLGPVDTVGVVGVQPRDRGAGRQPEYRLESMAGGLRVASGAGALLQSVELRGINGKLERRVRTPEGSAADMLEMNGLRQGVYLVRIESPSGTHQARAVIP